MSRKTIFGYSIKLPSLYVHLVRPSCYSLSPTDVYLQVESAATSAATGVENTAQNAAEKIAELVADDMDLEEIEKLERLLAVAKAKVQADATAKASKAAGVKAAETKAADARDVAEVSASIYAPKSTAASADEGEEDEVVRPGKRQRRS